MSGVNSPPSTAVTIGAFVTILRCLCLGVRHTLGSHQGDKPHRAEGLLAECVSDTAHTHELVTMRLGPDGDHETSTVSELFTQRLRYPWTTGGHHDGIKRGCLGVSEGAIPPDDLHVVIPELVENAAGTSRERFVPFDRPHGSGDPTQHGGPVPRSSADLQHTILRTNLCRLGHQRNDVGL